MTDGRSLPPFSCADSGTCRFKGLRGVQIIHEVPGEGEIRYFHVFRSRFFAYKYLSFFSSHLSQSIRLSPEHSTLVHLV